MTQEQIEGLKKMDAAAEVAIIELKKNVKRWSAIQLCEWWNRSFAAAGYKRLGRALVTIATAQNNS